MKKIAILASLPLLLGLTACTEDDVYWFLDSMLYEEAEPAPVYVVEPEPVYVQPAPVYVAPQPQPSTVIVTPPPPPRP
ncbi:MAG: hypothetical protein IJW07_05145, partial [Lentisphaeria bacterium]|nr:hypothetical protein [Lentisphaeria bacterium]